MIKRHETVHRIPAISFIVAMTKEKTELSIPPTTPIATSVRVIGSELQ